MKLIKITFLISFISWFISCGDVNEGKGNQSQSIEGAKLGSIVSASKFDSSKQYQVFKPENLAYYKTLYLQKRFLGKPLDSLSNYLGEYVNYTSLKNQKKRRKENYLRVSYANFRYSALVDTVDYSIRNVSASGWWIGLPKDTTQHLRYLCDTTVSKEKFDDIFSESLFGKRDTLEPLSPFEGCLLYFKKKEATIWVENFNDSVKIKRMMCGSRRALPHFIKPDSLKEKLLMPYISFVKPSEYTYCHQTYYPHLNRANEPYQFKDVPSNFHNLKSNDTLVLLEGNYKINLGEKDSSLLYLKDVEGIHIKGAFPDDRSHLISTSSKSDVVFLENSHHVTFENLTLGHYVEQNCVGNTISIKDCKNITFKNCVIYGSGIIGVDIENCENIVLDNVKIYDCEQFGVFAETSSNVKVTNSVMYDSDNVYLTSWGSKNVSAYNTHFIRKRGNENVSALSTSFPEDISDSSYYLHADECKFIGFNPKNFALGEEPEGDDTLGMHFIKTKNCLFKDFPQVNETCGH